MSGDVHLDRSSDAIATLVLDRPAKRNAVTFDMWRAIPTLLEEFERSSTFRVLVVRGAGTAAFSAGADISEFQTLRASSTGTQAYNAAAGAAQDGLAAVKKPTIALVRGLCIGGGCGIALSCDIRLADPSATFAITPARLGLVYPVSVTKRLVDVVGPSQAKRILFTGQRIDAERAQAIGLVDELHPVDRIEDETIAFADEIAARAQHSVRSTKRIVDLIAAGLTRENDETLALRDAAFDTDDYREGVRAFLEKRPANFTDS